MVGHRDKEIGIQAETVVKQVCCSEQNDNKLLAK